jgi:hypothetical protein
VSRIIKQNTLRTLSTLGLAQLQGFPDPSPDIVPDFKSWSPQILMTSPPCKGFSRPLSGAATSRSAPALIDGTTGAVIQ